MKNRCQGFDWHYYTDTATDCNNPAEFRSTFRNIYANVDKTGWVYSLNLCNKHTNMHIGRYNIFGEIMKVEEIGETLV
jgi:hypothetical protein